jgi:hypothetical protein
VEALDKLTRFFVGKRKQCSPLCRVQRRGCQDGSRHCQPLGNEIFEKPDRKGPTGHGARGRHPQILVNVRCFGSDRIQCPPDHRARAFRPSARDKVYQLPPTNGGIVAVPRGLAQHGQQTIVETHL